MDTIIEPQAIFFQADQRIPNNTLLPVLIYRKILEPQTAGKERLFKRNFEKSGWRGMWTGFIYDFDHFHPDAHEALAVAKGTVTVRIGGDHGKDIELESGDLVLLPAGTGHRMTGNSENLVVVGAYPPGQRGSTICKSLGECPDASQKIADVPIPENDPFYSSPRPLHDYWN